MPAPLDWRLPFAHGLYWADMGLSRTTGREDDIDWLNTVRDRVACLKAMAMRYGHLRYMATVSVLHAIPEGAGADVVDVFANGDLLIDNFTPGTLETVEVPAGTYDLAVFGDGQTPDDAEPVLIAEAVEVPAGVNATVTANLDADGAPDYFWPDEWDKAPSGFDPADYDCDDLDPDVQGC